MSLLFDVLKKLEKEAETRNAEASVPFASGGETSRRRTAPLILAALATVGLAAILFWIYAEGAFSFLLPGRELPAQIAKPLPDEAIPQGAAFRDDMQGANMASLAPGTGQGNMATTQPEDFPEGYRNASRKIAPAENSASSESAGQVQSAGKERRSVSKSGAAGAAASLSANVPAGNSAPAENAPPVASLEEPRTPQPARKKPGSGKNAAQNEILIEQRVVAAIDEAWQAFESGAYDEAYEKYRVALAHDPKDISAMLGLASVAQRKGDAAQAARFYERVLALNGQQPDALAGLAVMLAASDPVGWETRLALALERHPRHAGLWSAYGVALAAQRRWAEAANAFGQAAAHEVDNPDHAYNQAVALDQVGRSADAIIAYRDALHRAQRRMASFDRRSVEDRVRQIESSIQ